MASDVDKVLFDSRYSIDKVVQEGTIEITNNGDTTSGAGSQTAKIVTDTTPNTYGRAALARFRWSVDDGVNWQGMDSKLVYSFSSTLTDIPITVTLKALNAAVSVGCDDTTVYFRTANGLHGNQSRTSAQAATVGYTPTSQTFLIEYALYERD